MQQGYSAYKAYVWGHLRALCEDKFAPSSVGSCLFPDGKPRLILQVSLQYPFKWYTFCAIRALCRLRLGLFPLGHRGEVASRAKEVQCIGCNKWTKSPLSHVLFSCQKWAAIRPNVEDTWQRHCSDALSDLLCLGPKETGFETLCHLALEIQDFAIEYWKNRKGSLRIILP